MVQRRAVIGLTDEQVAQLRAQLAGGRAPRVVVRAASAGLSAGARGTLVRVLDPADNPEHLVVRVGGDEIPFGPEELALPARGGRRTAAEGPTAAEPAAAAPGREPAPAPQRTPAPERQRPPATRRTPKAATPTPPPPPPPAAANPRRNRPPAPISVTLTFADGAWTAEAVRAGRRVGRRAPVRPGALAALAELIDDSAIAQAVTETVESCRAQVAERAAALRAELAAAEAALSEFER